MKLDAIKQQLESSWDHYQQCSLSSTFGLSSAFERLHSAVTLLVQEIEKEQRKPDPLGEALNSGDGTYRP